MKDWQFWMILFWLLMILMELTEGYVKVWNTCLALLFLSFSIILIIAGWREGDE